MHKSLQDIVDSHEISRTVKQIALETPGAGSSDGTTIYFEKGYLCSALADANQKILDLERQIDEKEFEDSPFKEINDRLQDMEVQLQQVYDNVG